MPRLIFTLAMAMAGLVAAQPQQQWENAAGGKMAFDVASVRPGSFVPPSFALDAGDSFKQTGGRFLANFPLLTLMTFAYKINPAPEQRQKMLASVPSWFTQDRYTVEAQAAGSPTKDQFRLMMQSLLAERFHLAVHWETQQAPVFLLELATSGKLGSNLHPHTENPPCDPKNSAGASGLPCGNIGAERDARGAMKVQARNLTMQLLAGALGTVSNGEVTRPVLDRTGLAGGFDFTMLGSGPAGRSARCAGTFVCDPSARTTRIETNPATAPIPVLIVDKVERPSEN